MRVDNVPAGSTNVSVVIQVLDVTNGTLFGTAAYNSAGIKVSYKRGSVAANVNLTGLAALASETEAHVDEAFGAIDATDCKGEYRLDLPDAACAKGARYVDVYAFAAAWQSPGLRLFLDPMPDLVEGAIVADGANSTLRGMTDLSYLTYPADQLNGKPITFRTGNNVGCSRIINDVTVDGSNNVIIWVADALPNAMGTNDQFVIDHGYGLSRAVIQTQAAAAVAAFGPPTKTEMDVAHALLATPAQVATALGNYDGPTNAEMEARTFAASVIGRISAREALSAQLTVATDAGNSKTTFKVTTDASTDVRPGFLRLTSGALASESQLVKWTGTQVTVLFHTDMPVGLKGFSAIPADGVTGEFTPL